MSVLGYDQASEDEGAIVDDEKYVTELSLRHQEHVPFGGFGPG